MTKWIKLCEILVITLFAFQLTGCASSGNAAVPSQPSSALQTLTPSEALNSALKQIASSTSYTVSITKVIGNRVMIVSDPDNSTSPTTTTQDSNVSTTIKCLVNNSDQSARINTSNSTGDYIRVFTAGRWYILDSTNMLKPAEKAEWSAIDAFCTPMKNEFDINLLSLSEENYTYKDEETVNDQKVYAYSINLPQTAFEDAKKALSTDALTYSDLKVTNPQFTILINESTGQIVRLQAQIDEVYSKYSWNSGTAGNYTEFTNKNVTQIADYSSWNTTSVDTSEIVKLDDTTSQQYTGKYSNYLTFNFAKVDRLVDSSSDSFYISLRDLKGNTLSIMEQPTWYFTNDAMCSNYADTVYLQFLQTSDSSASIKSASLITVNNLNICQIVGVANGIASVQYLFTEPDDVAKAQKHELNSTYNISITPVDGSDPSTLFSDVIQSLKFISIGTGSSNTTN